jgi:hypothetical protein
LILGLVPKKINWIRAQYSYGTLHRTKESDALRARLAASTEAETLPAWVAGAYDYRGQKDNAVDLLEEDYARRESRLWEIKSDPLLDHNPFAVAVSRRLITVIGLPDSCLSWPTGWGRERPMTSSGD